MSDQHIIDAETGTVLPVQTAKPSWALATDYVQTPQTNPAVAYLISLRSKRSRRTMRSCLNNVARILGSTDLHEQDWTILQRHHVQAIMEVLADAGKAPATINTYLASIKGVALEAWMVKTIDTDTFQRIKQVRSIRGSRLPRGRALQPDEIRMLFFTCESDGTVRGIRDAAIIGVLTGCGLRRSEIVALDYEHLIGRDQALRVLGKGNKERLSYMPNGTWERLSHWIEAVRSDEPGPLFTRIRRFEDVTHDRLSDQAIYYILETRRVQAGLEPFAPHDLRRTFATTMLDNGEDIVTVKDAMGHADVSTTQRYDKRGDERLKQASLRINWD